MQQNQPQNISKIAHKKEKTQYQYNFSQITCPAMNSSSLFNARFLSEHISFGICLDSCLFQSCCHFINKRRCYILRTWCSFLHGKKEKRIAEHSEYNSFNKSKPKEKYKKYLVKPETIITPNYYGSMKVHCKLQMFNSRPEKLPSQCQWTTMTPTLHP